MGFPLSPLEGPLARFIDLYHRNGRLVADLAGWNCRIRLATDDPPAAIDLTVADGRAFLGGRGDGIDLTVRAPTGVLLDILELRRDPNEPYLFGELTVEGPEGHFMRLDYMVSTLCPR